MSEELKAATHYGDLKGTASADLHAGPVKNTQLDDLRERCGVPPGYLPIGLEIGWITPLQPKAAGGTQEQEVYVTLLALDRSVLPEGADELRRYAAAEPQPLLFPFRGGRMPVSEVLGMFKELTIALVSREFRGTKPRIAQEDELG